MKIDNYKIFLASPGDTVKERKVVEELVKDLNESIGSRHNFNIQLLKWENNVYPAFGSDGQDVINNQIGDDYDIFIGIMWKRFGTPTNRSESGTKEEFERAYQRFKDGDNLNIMFYFNNEPLPQDFDLEQFSKVKEFKREIGGLGGLHWGYENSEKFEKTLRNHLTNCVLDLHKSLSTETTVKTNSESAEALQLKPEFSNFLNDIEAVFAHSIIDTINLEHLYLAPDLKNLNQKQGKSYSVTNLDDISNAIDVEGFKYILIGNDTSGKTANTKYLFSKYFQLGLTPVLIKGSEINNNIRVDALKKLIENKSEEQYTNRLKIDEDNKNSFVIIIDDFHKTTKGKNKYWTTLTNNLEAICPNIIATGSSLMPLETLNGHDPFKNFDLFSILEFGPKLRYEITEKWYTLGTDQKFQDQNDIRRKIDSALSHIKTIIGKGYIPSHPFYLLSILQSIESGNTQNQNYSVHGFYYEHLINECFNKAVKDRKEIGLFYNYLTHLCFHLFELRTPELTKEEFAEYHELYCAKYDLSYNSESILKTLDSAKLIVVNDTIHIKEKYIYYFFVAKFISNNISKDDTKKLVSKMSLRIFNDEYASIIMFVTHLSKDEFIIQEIISNANAIFPNTKECQLQEDIAAINELIESIPDQVIELMDVDKNRESAVAEEDENERLENEVENETADYSELGLEDDISDIDVYARITRAFKTIDLLGQISKKYWGELDGDQKLELVNTTYNLGLRTLGFYLDLLQQNKDHIIDYVKELIAEKHIKDNFSLKENIEDTARDFIFRMSFLSSFGLTKRVSNSIGYDKLQNSFEKALDNNPVNSVRLIDLAIKLSFSSIKSQVDTIKDYEEAMSKNKLSFMVLRNLAIDHLHMFDTDYKTRSRLCQILKISEKEQLVIDATSKVKKKEILHTTMAKKS
jgi:hypothetical protein